MLVTSSVCPALASELGQGHPKGTGRGSSDFCWCWAFPEAQVPAGGKGRGWGKETFTPGKWTLLPIGLALFGDASAPGPAQLLSASCPLPLTPRHSQEDLGHVSMEVASSWISPSWRREPGETWPLEYNKHKNPFAFPIRNLDWGPRWTTGSFLAH